MTSKEFYNKKSELTGYALACGYIEKIERNSVSLTLWKEHLYYHVRKHDHNTGTRLLWNSYLTLTETRKDYNKKVALLKRRR